MSFPTCSELHPTVVAAAPEAPTIFRKSRRLTVRRLGSSLIGRRCDIPRTASVVTIRAIVAGVSPRGGLTRSLGLLRHRARYPLLGHRPDGAGVGGAGEPKSFLRIVAVDVTANAPAHVERRVLIDTTHVLHVAVTRL